MITNFAKIKILNTSPASKLTKQKYPSLDFVKKNEVLLD